MGRLRTPRVSQPQQIVGLDPSNKYSKRVIDGFFGTSGLTLRGKVITDSANITKTVSAAGKVRRGAANAGFSFPCDLTGNNGITVVFQYVQYSRSGTQVLFEHSVNQNTNAGTFIVYTDATASKLAFGTSAGGNYDAGTVALPALGDVVTVAVRLRFTASVTASDDIKIWINGVSPAFTSASTTSYAGNFGNYTTYFLSRAASSLQADASASMYAVLSGFASDAELRELSLNPWQLFAPVARSIWVPVAAGGDTYTLTADSGSFALTGQDTALNFNRTLAADSGSFALTGQAAALTFNRALVADSGSFALAGQDATPTFSRVLSAASGSYALAGQDATLTYTPISGATYTLAAASGSFALAGQDAALVFNRVLAADSGSFALTGQDATLARGYMMPAQSGDYSVAGQDAALIASRRLAADSEAFALTGQNADLTYTPITGNTYTLSASSGSFVLTGQDAQLLQNRALAADAATYALAGQGAALTYSGGVSAIYPNPSVVLFGTAYGPTGTEYTGTFSVPSAASIAAQVRTELAAELLRITEVAKIHGLVQGVNLVVTPTSRTAGDIAQTISGDGVSSSTVSRA